MGSHKVLKLAQAVEEIPPSNPRVITRFLEKICPLVNAEGELTDAQVISVVDSWPGGCPEGRNKYLASVGISRKPVNVLNLSKAGLVLLDGGKYGARGWSPWDYGNDVAKIKPHVSGLVSTNVKHYFNDGRVIYVAKDISVDLDRVSLTFASVQVDDDDKSWIVFETTFLWAGRANIGLVVPVAS